MRMCMALVLTVTGSLVGTGTATAAPGAIDPSFGRKGMALPAERNRMSFGTASAQQADGRLLVAGAGTSFGFSLRDVSLDLRVHPTVHRYQTDGRPDPTFGTGGAAKVYVQNHLSIATSVAQQPDGKLLVSGTSLGLLSASTFVARLHANGSLDTSFGGDGYVTTLPERMNALVPVSVDPAPDGRVLVTATSFSGDLMSLDPETRRRRADLDVVLIRYLPNGELDPSFGTGGLVEHESAAASGIDVATSAEGAPDGSVVVGGVSIDDQLTRGRALVLRFRADGSPDPAFGTNGAASQPSIRGVWDIVTAVERRADGGVTFGVSRLPEDGGAMMAVRRLDPAGQQLSWPIGGRSARIPRNVVPTSLLTLSDGRTLVGGVGSRWGDVANDMNDEIDTPVAAIARLHASGAADRSFDRGGASYVGRDGNAMRASFIARLHPAADGTVLASGTFDGHGGVVRFLGDSPLGVTTRQARVRVQVGSPAVRRCGFDRAHACRIRGGTRRSVRLDIATRGALPDGHLAHVSISRLYGGYWWDDAAHHRAHVSSGRATVRSTTLRRGGLYRIRAYVPASGRTDNAQSRLLYVRVVSRAPISPARRVRTDARSLCDGARRASTPLAANARAACDAAAHAEDTGMGVRETARRMLGR